MRHEIVRPTLWEHIQRAIFLPRFTLTRSQKNISHARLRGQNPKKSAIFNHTLSKERVVADALNSLFFFSEFSLLCSRIRNYTKIDSPTAANDRASLTHKKVSYSPFFWAFVCKTNQTLLFLLLYSTHLSFFVYFGKRITKIGKERDPTMRQEWEMFYLPRVSITVVSSIMSNQ